MIATPAYFRRKFKDFLGSIPPRPRGAGFPLAYLMNKSLAILLIIALIAMVICFPLLAIWAFNALVPFTIAVTFKTWLAALVLILVFGGSSAVGRSK